MKTLGSILIVAGIIIFIKPDIVAYCIATIFLVLGLNLIGITSFFQKQEGQSYRFGDYEILKRKK
jgi:hypothetical protein